MNILALDIGGANIKLADGIGYARSRPFALWKSPEKLAGKIASCLVEAPPHDRIVVTMTGELCDCYETKREGVRAIVHATIEAARSSPISFYQTTGDFVSADQAIENDLLAAASNWHALASFTARYCGNGAGMLIDVGSTTSDLIPIVDGEEAARGRTDPERLAYRELIYTGVERSPVCAVVTDLPWRGMRCAIAQEFFATSGDAYLLLGELTEDPSDTNTADGKPFTKSAAHARLARMICGDRKLVSFEEVKTFASHICERQLETLRSAFLYVVEAMPVKPPAIVLSGHGEFLARRLLDGVKYVGDVVSLTEHLGPHVSRCAPAHALAVLAREKS